MKKLSPLVLLLALLCCMAVFSACGGGECKDGHTPAKLEAVAPTCTENGLTEGSYCSVCQAVITAQKTVPATGHDKSNWINDEQIKLTCTTDGARYKECKTCHVVLEVGKIEHTGHEFGSWATVKSATCTAEGLKERTCDVCGYKESDVIAITHRNSTWTQGAAATCTADGFRYKTCRDCGIVTVTETLKATGHTCTDYTEIATPTCTQNGSRGGHCTTCNEDFVEAIDALGHDYPGTWTVVTAVSCKSAGLHTRTCKREGCGVTENKTLPQLAHETEWIVDVPASCEQDGTRHEECTLCHDVFTVEKLNKVSHDLIEWTTVVEATCQQTGLKTRVCPSCSNLNEKQVIPKTAHTESDWITDLAATCAAPGNRHKSCLTCNVVLESELLPQLSHNPSGTWVVDVAPTATNAGTSKQICISCGIAMKTSANSLNLDATVVAALSEQNLADYTVVYAASCRQNNKLYSYISGIFKPALETAAGKTFSLKSDKNAADDNSKQILIGVTTRKESKDALATLQGRGFTVRVDGNRIVILGTDDLLTMSALQFFVNNYLAGAGRTISIPEDATAAGLPVVTLASAYGSSYAYVFDADWDIDPYHMYVGDSWNNQGYPGDGREYPTYVYEYFLARISKLSGLPVSSFLSVNDTVTTYQNGYEVLFATADRPEARAFRDTLDANQYGFRIVGNKVILAAHIDAALEPMVAKFLEFYAYVLEYNGGVMPQGYEEVYTLSGTVNGTILGSFTVPNWKLSFSRPANTHLEIAENNHNDAIQLVYTGEGASVAGFLAYCAQLEAEGFVLVANTKNDNVGGTNNYFRLYKHTAKQTALYVAFDAFSYQESYADRYASENVQFGDFIHYSTVNSGQPATQYPMRTYKQCIRIVSSSVNNSYFPDSKLLTPQTYKKVCSSALTTIRYVGNSVGMGYVLRLEDGSFVIIDGGNYISENCDRDVLYNTLAELHKDAYGSYPSENDPIHITAWLVTHSHGDHYGNLNAFLKYYAPKGLIKMDYLVGNFPHISTIYPVGGDTYWMGDNITTLQNHFINAGKPAFKFVKTHTGITLHFANLKMEVLMTTEDHAPFRITNSNDTNTVTKWTISSTTAEANTSVTPSTLKTANATTWTVLGDSCIYASRWLCAMWGGTYNASTDLYDNAYMAADMVQLAHHGNIGCEVALYKTVKAEVVWFAHNAGSYNSYTQNGKGNWTRHVDNTAINLSTVKYIVVAGIAGTSYTDSVTISFNENGIYFPTSGNPAWGIKCTKSNGTITAVTRVDIPYNTPKYSWYDSTYVSSSPVVKK